VSFMPDTPTQTGLGADGEAAAAVPGGGGGAAGGVGGGPGGGGAWLGGGGEGRALVRAPDTAHNMICLIFL
jgi:hypothetical protein